MKKARIPRRQAPGRPAASANRDTRAMLLSAATELFGERGVAATTFANIAERAGLTPAMLHYHFKDRDQLLDAVVEERLAPLVAYVWDPVQPGDQPADIVRGVVARMLDRIELMPWVPPTWMREVLNEGGLLRRRLLGHLPTGKIHALAHAIAQGQGRNELNREVDPLLAVFSVLGMVMMLSSTVNFWAETFQRERPNREVLQRHITALLLDGLCHSRTEPTTSTHRKNS